MQVSTDFILKQSYVLNPEHMRSFLELFNKKIGTTKISAYCKDGITRYFRSATELLNYSNSLNSMIQSIALRAQSKDYAQSARAVFTNENWRPIQFEAEGPENIVVGLKDDFLKNASRIKAWYDRLARLDIFWLMLGFVAAAAVILLVFIASGVLGSNKPRTVSSNPRHDALAWLIIFGVISLLVFVGLLISKLRTKLFPIGTFAWGDSAARYGFLEKIRWTVVIGFIVSFLASIVAALL